MKIQDKKLYKWLKYRMNKIWKLIITSPHTVDASTLNTKYVLCNILYIVNKLKILVKNVNWENTTNRWYKNNMYYNYDNI